MPADGQASSGYLVATDEATVLLDCGPGVATALGSVATPDQLSAVIVSHLHLDHCYDLLPLGKSLLSRNVRYPQAGEAPQDWAEIEALPLHVPDGSRQRLQQLAALFPVSTAPVLLSFLSYNYGPPDLGGQGTQELIDAFEAANPTIKIQPQGVPVADALTKAQTGTAVGDPPDVAQIGWSKLAAAYGTLPVTPVQDIPSAAEWRSATAGMSQPVLKAVEHDGKVAAMPYTISTPTLFYNATLFRKAGLNPADPPATIEKAEQDGLAIAETMRSPCRCGWRSRCGSGLAGRPWFIGACSSSRWCSPRSPPRSPGSSRSTHCRASCTACSAPSACQRRTFWVTLARRCGSLT